MNCTPALLAASIFIAMAVFTQAAESTENVAARANRDSKGIISFVLENDYFAGKDDGYTNGFRASYLSSETEIPNWINRIGDLLPFFAKDGHKRYSLSLGQSMYAPSDLRESELMLDDRPYAGCLFGSVGLLADNGNRLDNLLLTLGVVGPISLAAQTQDFVHHAIGSIDPKGWDNQLKNEPGVILTYERKWRSLYELSPFGWGLDITPHIGASVGNIHTNATAGLTLRVGYDLPVDYGPPLLRPSLPGSDFFLPSNELGWYLFSGAEGRAVVRNIFLDGNTISSSHSVQKKIFVGGVQTGIAVFYKNVRIAYTHIWRTREFEKQTNIDEFGAVTFSYRL